MATLTFEHGTYTDCTIKSARATQANTSASGQLKLTSGGANESPIFVHTRASRNARFVPITPKPLTGDGTNSHHILVQMNGNFLATLTDGYVSETLAVDVSTSQATWNNFTTASAWTTTGGRDNVKPHSAHTNNLLPGSTGDFRGIGIGFHQVVHMLKQPSTGILLTSLLVGTYSFILEENADSAKRPKIVIKGRYATRNRENPVRSRKFGVR
jgi:hypothetical protein